MMKVDFSQVLFALSFSLDCVEKDVLGVTTNHGKRVAYMAVKLADPQKLPPEGRMDLAACAIMHDNALAESVKTELDLVKPDENVREGNQSFFKWRLSMHCRLGEQNVAAFPFHTDCRQVILYHHENYDGSGCFGKTGAQTPYLSQLVHLADQLDLNCALGVEKPNLYVNVMDYLEEQRGREFASELVDRFNEVFTAEEMQKILDENIDASLHELLPVDRSEYSVEQLIAVANIFAVIVDHKSSFTMRHSLGIAEKAEIMGKYYGFDREKMEKLYIAGALHDIGKLAISTDVLEKPGKLTQEEFVQMKNHAYYTYRILSPIKGLEDITSWAAYHHEKLDGSGYPFGKKAADLNHEQRLLACVDIYQALTEARPYKEPFSHAKAMSIMQGMVNRGLIDGTICADLEKVFGTPAGPEKVKT
jgi:HD-GYP domain-containing protein (c-di-GMP phosphodiesterase class II)